MLHLRPCGVQHPTEHQLDVLHQMARQLDMSNVCGMVQRTDVIVLQDTRGVEVIDERLNGGGGRSAVGVICGVGAAVPAQWRRQVGR